MSSLDQLSALGKQTAFENSKRRLDLKGIDYKNLTKKPELFDRVAGTFLGALFPLAIGLVINKPFESLLVGVPVSGYISQISYSNSKRRREEFDTVVEVALEEQQGVLQNSLLALGAFQQSCSRYQGPLTMLSNPQSPRLDTGVIRNRLCNANILEIVETNKNAETELKLEIILPINESTFPATDPNKHIKIYTANPSTKNDNFTLMNNMTQNIRNSIKSSIAELYGEYTVDVDFSDFKIQVTEESQSKNPDYHLVLKATIHKSKIKNPNILEQSFDL